MVERHLAKVNVASSNLVFRSKKKQAKLVSFFVQKTIPTAKAVGIDCFFFCYWRTITDASNTPDAFEPVTLAVLPFSIVLNAGSFPVRLSTIFVFEFT